MSSPRFLVASCCIARLSHLCWLLWLKAGSEEEQSSRWMKCPSRREPASRLASVHHESMYLWCVWRQPEVLTMVQLEELLILVEIFWLNLPVRVYLSFSTFPIKLPKTQLLIWKLYCLWKGADLYCTLSSLVILPESHSPLRKLVAGARQRDTNPHYCCHQVWAGCRDLQVCPVNLWNAHAP